MLPRYYITLKVPPNGLVRLHYGPDDADRASPRSDLTALPHPTRRHENAAPLNAKTAH